MASVSMSLDDMRSFVYESVDTDSTDLPTDVLDRFIIDGAERIEAFSPSWEFRQVDYSFATVTGVQSYDVRSASRVGGIDMPLRSIIDARLDQWSLKPEDHRRMRARNTVQANFTGRPTAMTLWGSLLYLWPTPDAQYTVSLLAIREPTDWVSTNSTPDLPNDLAELVAWWALSRAYARDGDPGMAQFYRDEFLLELPKRAEKYTGSMDANPIVMNGGCDSDGDWALSGRLRGFPRFDWE